jgi:hypothetical protein
MPTEAQIAGGHKANLNNPNTSQEAKEHSRQVLNDEFNGGDGVSFTLPLMSCANHKIVPKASDGGDKNPNNVIGGLKA